MASKLNAGYPGTPSYYEYTAPAYATLAPSGSSQETARLVQPQVAPPAAYPPVYSTTTTSYSTMNGQYYTAVPADKPYAADAVKGRERGMRELMRRGVAGRARPHC